MSRGREEKDKKERKKERRKKERKKERKKQRKKERNKERKKERKKGKVPTFQMHPSTPTLHHPVDRQYFVILRVQAII